MRIGVAKEIKPQEYRVALTPAGARELVQHGHEVWSRPARARGARSPTRPTAARRARSPRSTRSGASADLLLKVKEPIAPEYGRLREGLTLFTYLHIAADEPLTRALVDCGDHRRRLRDGRDRARRAAAARADERGRGPARGASGRALPREAERRPRPPARRRRRGRAGRRCVVIGGGIVGYNAAVIALGLGAQVTILERSVDRMRHLEEVLCTAASACSMSSTLQIEESLKDADVVIGAVLIPGALAPKLVTREMVARDEARRRDLRRRDRPGRLHGDVPRRPRTTTRSTSSTASSTTASPTCPARCRSPRRRR